MDTIIQIVYLQYMCDDFIVSRGLRGASKFSDDNVCDAVYFLEDYKTKPIFWFIGD